MVVIDAGMRGLRGCLPGMRIVAAALLAFALNAHALTPGEPAPAFALTDSNGKTIALASLRGRVVYVDPGMGFAVQFSEIGTTEIGELRRLFDALKED